ncbi:ABC transporter substrate-binding protein [Saccharibacillus alkalitolerans]|uniref:ABC transporter substrate-binding protein n=1 Tax=Saccharibacillus alkalitolerans TaxID=2705290 RepID=A0ABX0F837_9BACL|nr:ABC transporter substrate-binding protein [Saccharibacillus alkalitolerans]NGZ75371.1 ABC transporter substrate-binding protein [Saccharibacillus alkalitolerans]
MQTSRKWMFACLCMLMVVLTACGGGNGGQTASGNGTAEAASTNTGESAKTTGGEPVKVVWWHAMSGELGGVVDELVKQFNESQDEVEVEAVFQGTYDESLNKLKTAMGSGTGPTMIQTYEIGSRFMIDSGAITPMQQFIDAESYDVSHLEENILGYYTFDDRLYSMPFNTSNPILYYNKDAFKAAGLDPENPPKTYAEVEAAAKKLTKDGMTGGSFAIYGWFMEQLLANQGAELLNHSNGRDGMADEAQLGQPAAVSTVEWWKKMVDEGVMLNLGRKTDDTKKAFAAGQIAMTLDSTASLRGIVQAAEGKFEVGTAPLPKPTEADADKGGVVVGGASLWILNDRPEEEQQAAWKFIKFLAEPKTQAHWHVNTGYFPITKEAYNEDLVKENLKKYPQFQTAIDQLHNTELTPATRGAVMGVFPEARQLTETAIEEALTGAAAPQDALDRASAEITQKIQEYNSTVAQ